MAQLIKNGDYVKCDDKSDLKRAEYIDEIMQNVAVVLTARRSKFYPNKEFGSYIRECPAQPRADYALNYARQAVDMIDGVYIKSAEINSNKIIFNVIVNDEERQVSVNIENNI